MKKVFVKQLNSLIEFDSSIKSIKINNPENYRELAFTLNDSLIFSIDNEEKKIESYGLIIRNPFEIDLNEKKLLSSIYKKMQIGLNDEQLGYIQKIEENSMKLFDEILEDFDYHLEYNESLDITKLFANYNICFPEIEYNNYLELLSTYCKLNAQYNKSKIVISFGALNLLKKEEIELLEKEFEINDIVMLNISFISNDIEKKDLIIDDDWCII